VREQAVTADTAEFDNEGGIRSLLRRAFGRNPLDAIALFALLIAAGAILINALYRQPGPHPAPIFSVKPRPVATAPADVVPPMPRVRPAAPEASSRPRADTAADTQRQPQKSETVVPVPRSRPDPIGDLIAPAPRVIAVQRALNDFGYGPVKATGVYGPETIAAIQKLERDRKLQVTGQISPRLLRELATLTGKPIE
jgi:Putative peptidoglycan binding domain